MEAKKHPGQVIWPICPSSAGPERGLELAMGPLNEAIGLGVVGCCHDVAHARLSAEGGP
jgi:hypothetical protein